MDFGIHPLYFVSLPGYTWLCGLNYTGIKIYKLFGLKIGFCYLRKILGVV